MKKCGFKFNFALPKKLNAKASTYTLVFTYIYLIAEIIYKVKIEKTSCTWELLLLFFIFSLYGILRKLFSKGEFPCDLSGAPLPSDDDEISKKKRTSFYKKSAIIYSAIFAVITTIAFSCSSLLSNVNVTSELFFDSNLPNFFLAVIISVIFIPIIFIFAYMIEYLWYEYKISVYNEMKKKEEEQRELLLKLREQAKAEATSSAPKKRGRPKKEDSENTDSTPKRRGRPPKKTSEE